MRRATAIVVVLVGLAANAATAQVRATVRGTVRDAFNQPLAGALVSDGDQTVGTAPDGSYSLVVDPALVNTIRASKTGYATVSERIVPLAQSTVDFALPFKITASLSPSSFSSVPQTIQLQAKSLMPPAGSCLRAFDDRTGGGVTMQPIATDPSGVTTWAGGITLGASAGPGFYHVTFEGRVCATLALITDQPVAPYLFDREAPSAGVVSPVEGRLTVGIVSLPSRDGRTRVFGPVVVHVHATDDVGLGLGRIIVTPGTLLLSQCGEDARGKKEHRYVCGPFLFLAPGATFTLTVEVQDLAGKTSTVTMDLLVPSLRP